MRLAPHWHSIDLRVLSLLLLCLLPVQAQQPLPASAPVARIAVLGDSLAAGVWIGLMRQLRNTPQVEVIRHTQAATGLARTDHYDWDSALNDFLAAQHPDAIVFSIGLNDLQSLYVGGKKSYLFRSADWDRLYAQRIDRLMRRLQATGVPVFWVGLPSLRDTAFHDSVQHLNTLFRLQAEHFGIHYVSLWELSVDEHGDYSSYLRDAEGRLRQMRTNDGAHFTPLGYEMIGAHVLTALRSHSHILP